jgi:mRNA-degrading endonuclease HigB of HigAB toxin-antitoxin module
VTESGNNIAAFIVAGFFKTVYPMDHNIMYVDSKCIFNIPTLDYHIIPYMRYGTIALYLQELFPKKNFILKSKKAVEKLFKNIILYSCPASSQNIVFITNHKLVINDQIYEMDEIPLILLKHQHLVIQAISKTTSTNCIMTDFTNDMGGHSSRSFFFTIYKL